MRIALRSVAFQLIGPFAPFSGRGPTPKPASRPGAAEKQDITIGIPELKPTQTVIRVLQRLRKLNIARCKLRRQSVGIRNVEVSVPASGGLSLVVWQRSHTNVLEHDHRAAPAYDTEEGIVSRPLKCDLKSKLVAIERKRCYDILHDEKGGYAGNLCWCHMNPPHLSNAALFSPEPCITNTSGAPFLNPRGT